MKNDHLTESETIDILTNVYRGLKTRDEVIEKHNLSIIKKDSFYKQLPPPNITEECKYCLTTCTTVWKSAPRSKNYTPEPDYKKVKCPECHHKMNDDHCTCSSCEQERQIVIANENLEKTRLIHEKLEAIPDLIEGTLLQTIILGALFQHSTDEEMGYISPIYDSVDRFSPEYGTSAALGYLREVYEFLCPVRPLKSILIENGQLCWYPIECVFKTRPENEIYIKHALDTPQDDTDKSVYHFYVLDLCKRLMIDECVAYMEIRKAEYGFSMEHGDKTRAIFEDLLNKYTVLQVFSLIWRGCRDCNNFYTTSRMTKACAAKACITFTKKACDISEEKGWEINPYKRTTKNNESTLCNYVMRTILNANRDIATCNIQDIDSILSVKLGRQE